MTVTAPAETSRDAKVGNCIRCRNGQHSLCASPEDRCTCPFKDHPNRPTARAADPSPLEDHPAFVCGSCRGRNHKACTKATCSCTGPAHPKRPGAPARAGRPAGVEVKAKVEPVWELVKAAPAGPPKAKKPTPAELAQPMLETIAEAGDLDSWRVALFGTAIAATKARKALAEAFPEPWEWKSGRDDEGRPAVFVRWLGPATGDDS